MIQRQLFRVMRSAHSAFQYRTFVKVGDKLPINFQKEGKDPVIREDSEYPAWLKQMDLPTRVQLENKVGKEGLDNTNIPDLKRFLKLTNRAEIKTNNTERSL